MVQIVGNLEWELLKNVEIRKSIYAHITNTRFVEPFSRISPISRQITYFLLCSIKLCLYDMKYRYRVVSPRIPFASRFAPIPVRHGSLRPYSRSPRVVSPLFPFAPGRFALIY